MTTAMVNWYSVVLVGAALLGGLLHGWQYEMLTRRETVANIILSGVGALITPLIMDFPSKLGLPETFALMFVLSYFISPNVVSLLKTFLDKKFGPLIATPKTPLVLLPLLLLAGCATTAGQQAASGIVRAIPAADLVRIDTALDRLQNHGLIQLAMRDAADTQAWVDAQAPTLGPIKTAQARMCPTMVALAGQNLADKIQALRDRIKAAQTAANASAGSTLQGPEAILFLTQLKFGATGDPQAQINGMLQDVGTRLDAVVQGCLALFPTKQINQVLNLAGQAGLAGYMPALAPFIAAAGGPLGPLTNLVGQ